MWSPTKLNFSFYNFSIIYNDFSMIQLNFFIKEKDKITVTVATAVTIANQYSKPLEGGKMHGLKN